MKGNYSFYILLQKSGINMPHVKKENDFHLLHGMLIFRLKRP